MSLHGVRVALVGPLPPPAGGMANQTRQLAELLEREGAEVQLVPVNPPYRPPWIGRVRGARALFRLLPYLVRIWQVAARVDLVHVMANSGWSWHLFAAPAIWLSRLRGVPVVVNYRGGEAEAFLARSTRIVQGTLRRADATIVPSGFLQEIFARHGIDSEIVPNVIDVQRFSPAVTTHDDKHDPHVVVTRNLEGLYDIASALRAFALVRASCPEARLTVAGSGPEGPALEHLSRDLGIDAATRFAGRLDRDQIANLYRTAAVALNPSRVDNMPNSVLEAMASGVPVVSTSVGGVPYIVRDGETGLLVEAGDHPAMARAMLRVLGEPALAASLRRNALRDVQQYAWPVVRARWLAVYARLLRNPRLEAVQT
ncbi:MAG: glycosyltransferase family 4 protein [Casimicrobiaceae bacterium]